MLNKSILIVVCLISVFSVNGCGPGLSDSVEPIINDYYLSIVDRDSVHLVYKPAHEKLGRRVIGATVEQFFVWKNLIFISTRERIRDDVSGRVVSLRGCKYWIVDTQLHSVSASFQKKELPQVVIWNDLNESTRNKELSQRNLPCSLVW